jgi:hypothetical protein
MAELIDDDDRETIAYFTRPWSERRGLESMESHSGSILVKASIDELADALTSIAIESRPNVLGIEIEISSCFALTCQIVGQSWSSLLTGWRYSFQHSEQCIWPNAAQISRMVGQSAIDFQVSDTVGCIGYQLFEGGELVEYFSGSEEEDPFARGNAAAVEAEYYELMPYDDPLIQRARFWSKDRQLTAKEIGNIWGFPNQFLRDQDAYEPAIDTRYFLRGYSPERDQRYRIQNPGVTLLTGHQEVTAVPEFVRVDYFRFGT